MKIFKTFLFYILILLSVTSFSQSQEYNKRFFLEKKQISISKSKTRYWNSFSLFQKNKYLELRVFTKDSITEYDIKNFNFVLFDSQFKKVQTHYILGQRNVFTTSERKKKLYVNTDKIKIESSPEIFDDYVLIKYPLRKHEISTYSSYRESKDLIKGTYFLVVKYKYRSADTITLSVR